MLRNSSDSLIGFLRRPGSMDPESRPSLLVTFDLGSVHYYNRMVLFNQLNGAVNSGRMGSYSVSPIGFTFRPLEGELISEIVCTFGYLQRLVCRISKHSNSCYIMGLRNYVSK